MSPTLSEFSYGYAVAEDFMIWRGLRAGVQVAPVFPTLQDEGKPGGGYDFRLDRRGAVPFLFQFNLSHGMLSSTAAEHKRGLFVFSPADLVYRMHIWPLRRSNQHTLLRTLDDGSNEVFYTAPVFTRLRS